MRKLPSLGLALVLAVGAVIVMANSVTSTTESIAATQVSRISIDEIHRSIDLAALPAEQPTYEMF